MSELSFTTTSATSPLICVRLAAQVISEEGKFQSDWDVISLLSILHSVCHLRHSIFFPSAQEVVRLEFGEFLLHPGSLVHSGMEVRSGTRRLMVIFAHLA